MIQKIIIGSLAAIVMLAGSSPVFAESDKLIGDSNRNGSRRVEPSTEPKTENTAEHSGEVDHATEVERPSTEQAKQVAARKAELLERLAKKQAERKEKLEGRRLAQCENRQKNINSLIAKSITNSRTHLENIQRVEARVAEFYAKKQLRSEKYDSALTNVNNAESAAIATLDVMSGQEFDCQSVDGAKPSSAIQTAHQAKKEALGAYRQSVIELIKVTKQVFVESQSEASDVQN